MLVIACLFAVLAVLGSLVGTGAIANSIGAYHLTSYGWALFINAASLAILSLHMRFYRDKTP